MMAEEDIEGSPSFQVLLLARTPLLGRALALNGSTTAGSTGEAVEEGGAQGAPALVGMGQRQVALALGGQRDHGAARRHGK